MHTYLLGVYEACSFISYAWKPQLKFLIKYIALLLVASGYRHILRFRGGSNFYGWYNIYVLIWHTKISFHDHYYWCHLHNKNICMPTGIHTYIFLCVAGFVKNKQIHYSALWDLLFVILFHQVQYTVIQILLLNYTLKRVSQITCWEKHL